MKWAVGTLAVLVALIAGTAIGWVARARQDERLFDAMRASHTAPSAPPPSTGAPPPPALATPSIAIGDTDALASPSGPATGDVTAVDATHYVVRESWVLSHLDGTTLAKSARFVPERVDGGVAGIRLFGVRTGSTLAQLGLRNGDRVEAVNGISIASPQSALDAYNDAMKSKTAEMRVWRRGAPVDLHFSIVR